MCIRDIRVLHFFLYLVLSITFTFSHVDSNYIYIWPWLSMCQKNILQPAISFSQNYPFSIHLFIRSFVCSFKTSLLSSTLDGDSQSFRTVPVGIRLPVLCSPNAKCYMVVCVYVSLLYIRFECMFWVCGIAAGAFCIKCSTRQPTYIYIHIDIIYTHSIHSIDLKWFSIAADTADTVAQMRYDAYFCKYYRPRKRERELNEESDIKGKKGRENHSKEKHIYIYYFAMCQLEPADVTSPVKWNIA